MPQTRGSTTAPSVVKLAAPLGGRVDVQCDGVRMAWKAQRVLGTEDDSQRTCTET